VPARLLTILLGAARNPFVSPSAPLRSYG
jgi:hypothetical protein